MTTDFFTRLSERALALSPGLKPLIPSRYEKASFRAPQQDSENQELASESSSANKRAFPSSEIENTSENRFLTLEEKEGTKPEQVQPVSIQKSEKPRHKLSFEKPLVHKETNQETERLSSHFSSDAEFKLVDDSSRVSQNNDRVVGHASISYAEKNAPPSVTTQQDTLLPLSPPNEKEVTQQAKSPQKIVRHNQQNHASVAAPTIKVSIGRIEVKAISPTQTKTSTNIKRAKPTLSLNEYLAQRNRGQR